MKEFKLEINDDTRTELARYAHQAWSGWMHHLFECSTNHGDGRVTIPMEQAERWKRQMNTEFAALSEKEQASDYKEADFILATLKCDEHKDYGPGFLGAIMGTVTGAYYDMGVTREEVVALVATMFDGIKQSVESGAAELTISTAMEGLKGLKDDGETSVVDYAEIYRTWKDLPDTKIRLADDDGGGGESLWGKVLPDGTVGLNNYPLSAGYRWQDIVRPGSFRPELIHRRWHYDVDFNYEAFEDDEDDVELRAQIDNAVRSAGGVCSFFTKGVGSFLGQNLAQVAAVKEALLKLNCTVGSETVN